MSKTSPFAEAQRRVDDGLLVCGQSKAHRHLVREFGIKQPTTHPQVMQNAVPHSGIIAMNSRILWLERALQR